MLSFFHELSIYGQEDCVFVTVYVYLLNLYLSPMKIGKNNIILQKKEKWSTFSIPRLYVFGWDAAVYFIALLGRTAYTSSITFTEEVLACWRLCPTCPVP